MAEPAFEVVWPSGKSASEAIALAGRGQALGKVKTICELWDWVFRGEDIFPALRELLSKRYPGIKFIDYDAFGNIHGPKEAELIKALPEMLRKRGCDAVISGVGA